MKVLEAHDVEVVIVGGVAARAHGAQRTTTDIDCVADTSLPNLTRLAAALIQLGARLRVAGMSDDEARELPIRLDAMTLAAFGSTTWMTDAGPLDILVDIRDSRGERHRFSDLVERSVRVVVGDNSVRVAALHDIVEAKEFASRPKDLDALPELRRLLAETSEAD